MNEYFSPLFCCDFSANNSLENNCFNDNSYLKQNHLKWLLEKSDNYCNHWINEKTYHLFGLDIDFNDFNLNQITIIFTFVKKTLNELRTDSLTRSGNNRNVFNKDYLKLRQNVSIFLSYLRRRLFEICIKFKPNITQIQSKNENLFCISVIKQLKGLLLFVGRLSQLRPQLIRLSVNSDAKTSVYNYIHCCLDIWWTAVEVMYILDQNNKINLNDFALIKDQIRDKQLCFQSIQLVLFDLIVFSINRFNETKITSLQSSSLFDCLCVKQMYVLVRHMFYAINKSSLNDSFLELLFSTLNLIISDSNQCLPINDFKTVAFGKHSTEDTSLHFIWFVTNIIQTFNYDINGDYSPKLGIHSVPNCLLRKIIQFLRQNDSNFNEKLSAIIVFCLNCIKFWKPNTDLLLPLTEYFLKNLSKNFYKTSVEEFAAIPQSSAKWQQIIDEISSDGNKTFIENNFHLFLSLMSKQLSIVFNCETKTKVINWQKFKGKFLVNLHLIRFENFDEIAIFNLFSFYLVLINVNNEIWTEFLNVFIETIVRLLKIQFNQQKSRQSLLFLISLISEMFAKQQKERLLFDNNIFNEFIETNLSDNNWVEKLFEVINSICKTCPNLFHHFIGQINRTIESIEKKRSIGTDFRLRNALKDFANKRLQTN